MKMLGCTLIATKKAHAQWDRVKHQRITGALGASPSDINRTINRQIAYKSDVSDYWQGPSETLYLGRGDCEDFAILKRAALLAAAYRDSEIMIVIGYDNILRANHAVCAFQEMGISWKFCDHTTSDLLTGDRMGHFAPKFGFTGASTFIFSEREPA